MTRHVAKVLHVMQLDKIGIRHNHAPGPCRYVEGPDTGSEDLQLLSDGLVFVTTGLRWPHFLPYNESIRTGIYTFDFKTPNDALKNALSVETDGIKDVRSYHGLGLWQDKMNGETTLFAVAHREKIDTVELFKFDRQTRKLHHKRTIESSEFVSLNDVLATGPDSFYVTNDGCIKWSSGARSFLSEMLLLWNCGSIVNFDGNSARVVGDKYFLSNGLYSSSDGKTLYMAQTGKKNIVVFQRNTDNSIEEIRTIDVGHNPDNVIVDEKTGDLLVGGADGPFDLSVDPPIPPSSILRIQVNNEDAIDELYRDDGKKLSFASVALRYENSLLIGTVLSKLMVCELNFLQGSQETTSR